MGDVIASLLIYTPKHLIVVCKVKGDMQGILSREVARREELGTRRLW